MAVTVDPDGWRVVLCPTGTTPEAAHRSDRRVHQIERTSRAVRHQPNMLLEADVEDELDWDPQNDDTRIVVNATSAE